MAKRKIIFFLVAAVAVAAGAVGFIVNSRNAAQKETGQATGREPVIGKSNMDREAALAELARKRGGLPIDQAMRQAATAEAKEFIRKDMAYQRQTRAGATEEARVRLGEVRSQLAKESDEKKKAVLEKQASMLEELIANLEK